jgi:phenylalanyl-tRNA synthetase beta chain
VPVSWLREYVAFDMPVEQLGERLSLAGTKVEAIHRRGVPADDGLDLYRVGRVVSLDPHPNADRLSLCRVDVGEAKPRQIVCGASNFAAGATVAVVLPGATLPGGHRLGRARLRGVESDGMILSERELELSNEHAGIMVLPSDWPVGDPLAEHLPIAESVIEFEVTPNRPDCLCVYGIAREVSAVLDADLAPWPGREPAAAGADEAGDHVRVRVEAPDLCPRWAGRVFADVRVGESPPWLKARLAAAGMRAISNVVDITNYVMLAVGEPTHAFDLDLVAGREIVVRRARDGEDVVTLDGVHRTLDRDVLVIADAEKPSAIAGLMGSEWSEVRDTTTTVLLECANFDGPNIHASSARLGLRTEGSGRWEKGLDPYLPPRALALASQLMVELCGARLVPGTIDVHADLPERPLVRLREERLERTMGIGYEPGEVERILTRLGFGREDGGWRVPTFRARDVTREIDVIEEVARVAGLDRVPPALPRTAAGGGLSRPQRLRRRVADVLLGAGLSEAVTIPFADAGVADRLRLPAGDARRDAVRLRNPLGGDQALLRTTALPGLLDAVRRNLSAGADRVALFELGIVFRPGPDRLADQPRRVAGVLSGGDADFFAVKGVLETLWESLGGRLDARPAAEPFLHPGRAATAGDAGTFGELHPLVAEAFGIEARTSAFDLDLAALLALAPETRRFRDVTTFPPLRQDIAVIVGDDVLAGDVVAAAREAGGELLAALRVFDVYRGAQVGDGRYSLALHLVFQAPDRTLTDAEATPLRERVVAELSERFGAELRG